MSIEVCSERDVSKLFFNILVLFNFLGYFKNYLICFAYHDIGTFFYGYVE